MTALAIGILFSALTLACARVTWRIATMRITNTAVERRKRNTDTLFKSMARTPAGRAALQEGKE